MSWTQEETLKRIEMKLDELVTALRSINSTLRDASDNFDKWARSGDDSQ